MDYSELNRLRDRYMRLYWRGEYDMIPPKELALCKQKAKCAEKNEQLYWENKRKYADAPCPF